MNKITRINFGYKTNYVSYEDTDASVDLFHGLSLNQRDTAKYLKEQGAEYIQVFCDYNEDCGEEVSTFLNRIAKVAKAAGYTNNVKLVDEHWRQDNINKEWKAIKGQFIKQ